MVLSRRESRTRKCELGRWRVEARARVEDGVVEGEKLRRRREVEGGGGV